jgi:fused signal recognition particle receptor
MNDVPKKQGFFARLTQGLTRTAQALTGGVTKVFTRKKLDQAALDELEELLIAADMGAPVAEYVVNELKTTRFNADVTDQEMREALAKPIA